MGSRIHAQRETRDNREPCGPQCLRKLVGVVRALRSGVSATHHGQAAPFGEGLTLHQSAGAHHVEHERRVLGVEQFLGIAHIPQGDDGARSAFGQVAGVQPLPGLFQQFRPRWGHRDQRARMALADALAQRCLGLCKEGRGQPKGGQQFARGLVADARCGGKPQPCA